MSTIYNNGTEYGGGTTNYNDLSNKPKVGGVELSGNKTISQLGGVQTFNGRSGSVLPMAGDYSAEQVDYNSNQTVKQKIDALVTKEASDIAGQQSLVKDTVGWTGKNLLPYPYISPTRTVNGMTYTDLGNGEVRVTSNGATTGASGFHFAYFNESTLPKGKYYLSDGGASTNSVRIIVDKHNGSTYVSQLTSLDANRHDVEMNVDYDGYTDVRVTIYASTGATANNLVFKPMIRRADITDPTYEPYHESVEVMYEEEIHGVNLLPFPYAETTKTHNGVTFTVNSDGSVTVNGTATANADFGIVLPSDVFAPPAGEYIISRGGSLTSDVQLYVNLRNGTNHVRQITNLLSVEEFKFTLDYNGYDRIAVGIFVNSGKTINNFVIKPMLRKADIEDSTYRPYNPQAIQNQLNAQGVLGAKNLLPFTRNSAIYTQSGITYTRNTDGSITANGTATGNSFLPIAEREKHPINNLKKGVEYILSGDYGLGSGNGYVYSNFYNGSTRISGTNTGGNGSVKFKIPESFNGVVVDDVDFGIGILNGKTVNNFTFYPMLRLASDPDDTYVPYAMTNRELTERIKTIVSEAITEAFSAHSTKWHDNANDCNVGFERTNDYRTSNMPTTGTESASVWYDIMTVRDSNNPASATWGYGFQIAVQTTSNSTFGDTYVRAVNGGATPTWSEWKKLN